MQIGTVSRLWLCRRSWRFKSTSGGTLCLFGSHTFVPISWMCKKQTSVSHSSTESEIISLDTGLRLDGLAALELWDLIVSVLGNFSCFRWIRETWEWCSQTSEVSQQNWWGERHWFGSLKCSIRESWSFIACVWGQWGCDQDDNERKESYNETRFQNPQSCSWLVVRSN